MVSKVTFDHERATWWPLNSSTARLHHHSISEPSSKSNPLLRVLGALQMLPRGQLFSFDFVKQVTSTVELGDVILWAPIPSYALTTQFYCPSSSLSVYSMASKMITCVFDRATMEVNDLSSGVIRPRCEQTSSFPSLVEPKRECPSSSRRPGPDQP